MAITVFVLAILNLIQLITLVVVYYSHYKKQNASNTRIRELESIIRALQAHVNSVEHEDKKSNKQRGRRKNNTV